MSELIGEIVTGRKGQYKLQKELDSGAFATVYECEPSVKPSVKYACKAIKVSSCDAKQLEKIRREIDILESVRDTEPNNQYVLHLVDLAVTDDWVYLITPLVEGGNLLGKKPLSESVARRVLAEVVIGIQFLHMKNICHRDIKPDNILCTEGDPYDIVVADFGLSKVFGELVTQCGTNEYAAPEIWAGKPYTEACDMWSFGCTMYACLTACFPFFVPQIGNPTTRKERNDEEKRRKRELGLLIREGRYNEATLEELRISPEACDLIKGLLQVDPAVRLTPEAVLKHPWMAAEVNRLIEEGKYTPACMIRSEIDEHGITYLYKKSSTE